MRRFKFFSLRWQIALIILLGTFVFSVLTLFITYRYISDLLTRSLLEEGEIIAQSLSDHAAEKLIEDDIVGLKNIIEKYKYYSNIEYILIEDFNNQIKTDTYNGNIPEEIREIYTSVNKVLTNSKQYSVLLNVRGKYIYDITQPIKEGLLGFVRVGMKKKYVDQKIKETLYFLVIVFIGGTFLAIILTLFIITLKVSKPIAYLTDVAYKISLGDFNTPVNLKTRNEIGVLGEAIERMRESLKTSIERLRKR